MALVPHLRSRCHRRSSVLVAAITTVMIAQTTQAEDESEHYGSDPVVVSPLGDMPTVTKILDAVKSDATAQKPTETAQEATKLTPATESIPEQRLPDPVVTKSTNQDSGDTEPVDQMDNRQTENNESVEDDSKMSGGVTVPILMASDRQAKSTLELKPVAGPLFGRSRGNRLFKQGLFRSQPNADSETQSKSEIAKNNPAIPKPPAYVPKSPSATPQPVAQRPGHSSPQPIFRNQTNQSPSNLRWSPRTDANAPVPLRDAPLRDASPQPALVPQPELNYVRSQKPKVVAELEPSRLPAKSPEVAKGPVIAPELERPMRLPALKSASKNPPDVSVPSVELDMGGLNAPAKSEPILVSPTAPKKLSAAKRVPSAELAPVTKPKKKPEEKEEDSLQAHMRREAEQMERNKRKNSVSAKQQKPSSRETVPAREPDASVASRYRHEPVRPRVAERMPMSPTLDYVGYPATPIRVRPEVQRLKPMIERNLQYFYDNPEIASGRSNWGMMHAIMVYGIDTRLRAGNRNYSTIAWIAGNNICRGQRLLTQDARGIKVKSGVGLQGHQAQMLAIFSLCDVPATYPLYANDTRYSMQHVIEAEKLACKSGEELTFTLIGLSHYLDTDTAWIAADGQRWDFERLIREELSQPIVGTACGGTHRLMGFAHALRKRRHEGKPITGQWARAEHFLRDFISYTYTLQNRDGSMSTNWFEGRGDNGNLDRKIQTTGHMVELLLTVTPDSQLQDPRLYNAVRFLAVSMHNDLGREWKIGPKGHALRSMMMYHDRVFKSGPAWQDRTMAQGPTNRLYR